MAAVLYTSTAPILAVSGNFIDGETNSEVVNPDVPVDGGDAWAKSDLIFEWE